jgi:bacterioferritin-associated ferredoxin
MVVCICKAITESELETAIRDGASSLDQILERWGAGAECGACCDDIERRIEDCQGRCADCPGSAASPVTTAAAEAVQVR